MLIQEFGSQLIVASNDNVIVWDRTSGNSHVVEVPNPQLPVNPNKGQLEVLNKQDRTITSIGVSSDQDYFAIATENKQVVVYDKQFTIKKNFLVNRTASKVVFSGSSDILVADRTGDVFLYDLHAEKNSPNLLLGHLSMILDIVLTPCGKYVITCDRDEKIRVSCFPNTYNIVSYCLGHKEFVTNLQIVNDKLISASGDGTVRMWNYLKGEELNCINSNEFVDDTKLFQEFVDEMGKENVSVAALPITDMQTINQNFITFMAISLYHYNGIQIYKILTETNEWSFIKTIKPVEIIHKFYLSTNLHVFGNSSITSYKMNSSDYEIDTNPEIDAFYEKYKHILQVSGSSSFTVLYKRKFDNVQEYLDRKKIRIESIK